MKDHILTDGEKKQSKNKSASARGWKRLWFRLLAIVLGFIPFVLFEVVLIIFNIAEPTRYDDPFVGFSSIHPLFVLNEETGTYDTAASRKYFFGMQHFSSEKKKDSYRVFCLGGSTVRGRPHETDTSFPKWLEIELAGQTTSKTVEVVNAGGVSYASFRLRPILSEVVNYNPDLIVVATGHNEFLEDRTYQEIKYRPDAEKWITEQAHSLRTVTLVRQLFSSKKPVNRTILASEAKTKLDESSGYSSYHRDEKWWQNVTEHYRVSIETMIRLCNAKNVPIVLVNLGSNLRDCPPFKSEHKPGLTPEDLRQWETTFELANLKERTNALTEALELYRQAEKIDNEHGLLLFRIARCLDRLEKKEEALQYYIKAKEWDVCPLRMREAFHSILKEVATTHQVPLVDVKTMLATQSKDGLPGFDVYLDHVHPSIASHQKIAQAIFTELNKNKLVTSTSLWNADDRRLAYTKHMQQLLPNYFAGTKQRIQWVENWARREKLADEIKPVTPEEHVRLGYRELEIGRQEQACNTFSTAIQHKPKLEQRLVQAAFEYFQQGQLGQARRIVDCLSEHPALMANRKNHYLIGMTIASELNDNNEALRLHRLYKSQPASELSIKKGWAELTKNALQKMKGMND